MNEAGKRLLLPLCVRRFCLILLVAAKGTSTYADGTGYRAVMFFSWCAAQKDFSQFRTTLSKNATFPVYLGRRKRILSTVTEH